MDDATADITVAVPSEGVTSSSEDGNKELETDTASGIERDFQPDLMIVGGVETVNENVVVDRKPLPINLQNK